MELENVVRWDSWRMELVDVVIWAGWRMELGDVVRWAGWCMRHRKVPAGYKGGAVALPHH